MPYVLEQPEKTLVMAEMAPKNGREFSRSEMGLISLVRHNTSAAPTGVGGVVVPSAADISLRYGRDSSNLCDQRGRTQCTRLAWSLCVSRSGGRREQMFAALRVVSTVAPGSVRTQMRGAETLACKRGMQAAPGPFLGRTPALRGKRPALSRGRNLSWTTNNDTMMIYQKGWGCSASVTMQWVREYFVEGTQTLQWWRVRKRMSLWLTRKEAQSTAVKRGVAKPPTKETTGATSAKDGNVAANTIK
jgi:hypothetical protein